MAFRLGAGCVDGPASRLGEPAAGGGRTDRRPGQFQPERAEHGRVVPADDYGLLLDDPEGSSKETDVYRDADAWEEDTGTSVDPGAARSGGGNA